MFFPKTVALGPETTPQRVADSWPILSILSISFSSIIAQNRPPLALNACHSYVRLTILAPQWQGGNTSPCHCEARIASLGVPAVKITPNRLNTINYTTRWCNFHHGERRVLHKERCCRPRQQDSPPLPKTPPGAYRASASARSHQKN